MKSATLHIVSDDRYEEGYRDGANDAADTVCQHNITLTQPQIDMVEGAIRRMAKRIAPQPTAVPDGQNYGASVAELVRQRDIAAMGDLK